MRHRRFLAALGGLAVLALAGAAVAEPITLTGERPIVIAHRGASGYLPEHTLQGYELAVQMGADFIEPDLFLTADGVLVARHDRALNATTNIADVAATDPDLFAKGVVVGATRQYYIDQLDYADIQKVEARSRTANGYQTVDTYFDPAVDYKVPTFVEVLDYVYDLHQSTGQVVGVYPEVKTIADAAYNLAIAQAMLAALADPKYGGFFDGSLNNIFLQSFDQSIATFLNGETDIPVVHLRSCPTTAAAAEAIKQYADGIGVSAGGAPNHNGASQACIDRAHAAGLFVHAYTLTDNQTSYETLYGRGIDGIFGNHPDVAKAGRDAVFPVPVPMSAALFLPALLGLGLVRRRR